jgi:hypothetical protein
MHGFSGPIVFFKEINYFPSEIHSALIESHFLNKSLLLNKLTSVSMIRFGRILQSYILVSISVIQGEGC